jgi:hypothetical protein
VGRSCQCVGMLRAQYALRMPSPSGLIRSASVYCPWRETEIARLPVFISVDGCSFSQRNAALQSSPSGRTPAHTTPHPSPGRIAPCEVLRARLALPPHLVAPKYDEAANVRKAAVGSAGAAGLEPRRVRVEADDADAFRFSG